MVPKAELRWGLMREERKGKKKNLTFLEVKTVLNCCHFVSNYVFWVFFEEHRLLQVLGLKKYCSRIKAQNGVISTGELYAPSPIVYWSPTLGVRKEGSWFLPWLKQISCPRFGFR